MRPILRSVTAVACLCALSAGSAQAQRRGGLSQVPLVVVPNVLNRPVQDALAIIDKVGLARGNVAERPAPGRPGLVFDQSLTPGSRAAAAPR